MKYLNYAPLLLALVAGCATSGEVRDRPNPQLKPMTNAELNRVHVSSSDDPRVKQLVLYDLERLGYVQREGRQIDFNPAPQRAEPTPHILDLLKGLSEGIPRSIYVIGVPSIPGTPQNYIIFKGGY